MSTDPPDPSSDGMAATVAGEAIGGSLAAIKIGGSFDQRFEMHAELARGGMGRVAVATDTTLRREVAIKELIELGDAGLTRRFEREALITARLQHPGIVGVYEFARRDNGVAAIIMRRVRGRPFGDAMRDATTREQRIELLAPFISACDAVAYAHQQGVIHRDLKPANVLLGDFGDTVVIDWGLAKDLHEPQASTDSMRDLSAAVEAASARHASLTAVGAVMGTPAYMAPEQAKGEPADARSDVYALGAMLYQLLGGSAPYEGEDSRAVVQAVLRGPPRALLDRAPLVQPELVTIVERAMARKPSERYADAGALAAELKRFQTGQLVSSHRYTTRALLSRWVRRHAAAVTASLIAVALLLVVVALAFHSVVSARDEATTAAESAQRLSDFMVQMFKVTGQARGRAGSISARQLLDLAASAGLSGATEDEKTQAQLMMALGEAYVNLGVYDAALRLFQRAVEICTRALGAETKETLMSRNALAGALLGLGKASESEAIAREVLAIATRKLPRTHDVALKARQLITHALSYEGRFQEAEHEARENLAIRLQRFGPNSVKVADTYNELATALSREKKSEEALEVRKQALRSELAAPTIDYQHVLAIQSNLAADEYYLHRYAEAEATQREMLAALQKTYGPEHPDTLTVMGNLANTMAGEKKYDESEKLLLEVLATERRAMGPKAAATATELYNLACLLAQQGKRERALAYLGELVDLGVPGQLDVAHDEDLKSLHGDPVFEALLARVKASAATKH
jgi:tetratricopeptide (TPR) repeat protein